MSEILPDPISFQVKNIITIDGNILLEPINTPPISGNNGTLYKLFGSNGLYWKTSSGVIDLTSNSVISFPLLAPSSVTIPQYSFSESINTGLIFNNINKLLYLMNNGNNNITMNSNGYVSIFGPIDIRNRLFVNGSVRIDGILNILNNIILNSSTIPAVSNFNGALYKLIDDKNLYWKTSSGIVSLTDKLSFPLYAPSTLVYQYSFADNHDTGIGYYDTNLNFKNDGNLAITINDLGHVGIRSFADAINVLFVDGDAEINGQLIIDNNIVIYEYLSLYSYIEPSLIYGNEGALYKLIGDDSLYWKTSSGIVNLTNQFSFPLYAPTSTYPNPQYSFADNHDTGMYYFLGCLCFMLDGLEYIGFVNESGIRYIYFDTYIDMQLNNIRNINNLDANYINSDVIDNIDLNSQQITISSPNLDTKDLLLFNGNFNVIQSGKNYTVISNRQNYNISDTPVNSTGISLELTPNLNFQGYQNAQFSGGLINIYTYCNLNGTDNLVNKPFYNYIGMLDIGLKLNSGINYHTIDNVYGIVIDYNDLKPSTRNGNVSNFYGIFIQNPGNGDPNIYNKYGLYSEVPKNYFSSISLKTTGGTRSNLDYYEIGLINITISGAWGQFITMNFTRIGNNVSLLLSENVMMHDVSATNLTLLSIPDRLKPLSDIYGFIFGVNNSSNTTLSYKIATTGDIIIGAAINNITAPFDAGSSLLSGYFATSINYIIA
jgi:hypothetical protein